MKPALVSAIAALLFCSACASAKPTPDLPPALVTYRSERFPYTLTYDLNRWRILDKSEKQFLMPNADLLLADAPAQHFVAVLAEPSHLSASEMRTRVLLELQRRGPDLRVLSEQPVTVAGAPALQLRLRMSARGEDNLFDLIFLQYGGIAYQLVYQSKALVYDERAEDFRNLARSFKPQSRSSTRPVRDVAYPSIEGRYIITLPEPEWQPGERTVEDAERQFATENGLAFLAVIIDPMEVSLEHAVQMGINRLNEASHGGFEVFEQRDLTVDDIAARVVFGLTTIEGNRFAYAILFAVHSGRVYQFAGWAPEDLFRDRYQRQFLDVFASLEFVR